MAKLPQPPVAVEDFDEPTKKRSIPAELRDPHAATYVTTKLRTAEINKLLVKEREKSGVRPAVSEEDIERFELREQRETLPAPPLPDEVEDLDAAKR